MVRLRRRRLRRPSESASQVTTAKGWERLDLSILISFASFPFISCGSPSEIIVLGAAVTPATMFEGFSFSSAPSRREPALQIDRDDDLIMPCDNSNMVSPLSSRCPSPAPLSPSSTDRSRFSSARNSRSQFNNHLRPAPTSIPPSYIEDKHRLSIGSLTHKLHAHTIENNEPHANAEARRGIPMTPPHSSSRAEPVDLEMPPADMPIITTSHWTDPLTPEDTDRDDDTSSARRDIRNQREALSILQSTTSNVGETIRLAVILNDTDRLRIDDRFVDESHHPSSIPPLRTPRRPPPHPRPSSTAPMSTSTSSSHTSISRLGPNSRKSKIDKSHYASPSSSSSGNNTSLFSSQGQGIGLRRRSLVLAAVSAVLEAEQAANQRQRHRQPSSTSGGLLTPRSSLDMQLQSRKGSRCLPIRSRVQK